MRATSASDRSGAPTRATGPGAAALARVGAPDLSDADVARIQHVLVDTGAVAQVEELIVVLTSRAVDAIEAADVTAEARDELVDLAWFVASRDA